MNTNIFRANKIDNTKVKLVHTTFHLHPLVRAELERIANEHSISLSNVGADALAEWVHLRLHKQHDTLLYPLVRKAVHEELTAFGNRIIKFLMQIAFSAEHARLLTINVLGNILQAQGAPIKKFRAIRADSAQKARENILSRPEFIKTLVIDWDKALSDPAEEAIS